MFLKISQNSQENTCARVCFLIKLQAEAQVFFLVDFTKVLRTPLVDASEQIDLTLTSGENIPNAPLTVLSTANSRL